MLMACMLLIGMLPSAALAAGANALDSTATTADPAGPGYKLTLTGLENGDTAKYYQIIKQDVDTVDDIGNVTKVGTQDWKLTSQRPSSHSTSLSRGSETPAWLRAMSRASWAVIRAGVVSLGWVSAGAV